MKKRKISKQLVVNNSLEALVDFTECTLLAYVPFDSAKAISLLGEAIRNYEANGFLVPEYYKNKYNKLRKKIK